MWLESQNKKQWLGISSQPGRLGWWWKVTRIPPNPPRIQVFRNHNCNLRCICRMFLFLPDLWPKLPKKFGSQTTSNPYLSNPSFLKKKSNHPTKKSSPPHPPLQDSTQKMCESNPPTTKTCKQTKDHGTTWRTYHLNRKYWLWDVCDSRILDWGSYESSKKKRVWGWFSFSSSSHIFGWRNDLLLFFQSSFGAWAHMKMMFLNFHEFSPYGPSRRDSLCFWRWF